MPVEAVQPNPQQQIPALPAEPAQNVVGSEGLAKKITSVVLIVLGLAAMVPYLFISTALAVEVAVGLLVIGIISVTIGIAMNVFKNGMHISTSEPSHHHYHVQPVVAVVQPVRLKQTRRRDVNNVVAGRHSVGGRM